MSEIAKLANEEIIAERDAILDFFDKEAKDGEAEGDLFGGWDWPTMRMLHPEKVQRYRELKTEYLARMENEKCNAVP